MILDKLHGAVRAALAAGARDAEVSHDGRELETIRFANSMVTQAAVVRATQTRVRVLVGDQLGSAMTTSLEPDDLADTAARAVAVAKAMPPSRDLTAFASTPVEDSAGDAEATPIGAWAPLLEQIFAAAARHGLTCAGSLHSGPRDLAVVTAGGVARRFRGPEAGLSVIALDGDASGYAAFCGRRLDDPTELDVAALADQAVETGAAARGATELAPGEYDVLLSPFAVAELLEWMSGTSFGPRPVLDGSSLLAGRRGELVCDPRVTIVDDWDHPASVRRTPFDAEGTSRRRVTFIDAGRAGGPVSDLATGERVGDTGSSGHAAPLGADFVDGPAAGHIVVMPGQDGDLLARMERGLAITRLHYVNGFLDTRRAGMTGMTRDGLFLVENGVRGKAVRNLRFTDSILEALGPERLVAIGDELTAVATQWTTLGAILAPAILVKRFRFTGKSR